MKTRIVSLNLVLIFSLIPAAEAQPVAARSSASCVVPSGDLHQAVVGVHEKQRNVGLSAIIVRDGEPVFMDYLGLADLEHDVPVGPETRFGIASITKLFTAATVLKLHATGQIDLDAPVQTYVANFPEKPEGEITVRMLLTHRSGIPHPQERTPELFATHYDTATEALVVFKDWPLVIAPGTKRVYSSSNYNLLAAIVEHVTGHVFTEVVEQEIFEPLRLQNTSFDNVLKPLPHRARRYSFYHPWTYAESQELFLVPLWDYSFNMGGGNITATAADMAAFGAALTKPGLLPPEQLDLLYSEAWFGGHDEQGRLFIYVTGSNPGVQTGLTIYRDQETATAVLSNTWGMGARSGEMVALAKQLAQMCMGN